jgi:hypothetical protein
LRPDRLAFDRAVERGREARRRGIADPAAAVVEQQDGAGHVAELALDELREPLERGVERRTGRDELKDLLLRLKATRGSLAVGDIPDEGGETRLAAGLDPGERDLDGEFPAACMQAPRLDRAPVHAPLPGRQVPPEALAVRGAQALGLEQGYVVTDDGSRIMAEDGLHGGVGEADPAFAVEDDDGVRGRIPEPPPELVRFHGGY